MTERAHVPDAASLLALLVAGDRLPVVAALVLGAASLPDIAERSGVPLRDVQRVLTRLESAGLASVDDNAWRLHTDVLREAVMRNPWPAPRGPGVEISDDEAAASAVLRAFFRDGRLLRIPAHRSKRRAVLDHLARDFEPGLRYSEVEVNEKLSAYHPDYAALRRYMVEEDFLARENGVYWRSGGTVDV